MARRALYLKAQLALAGVPPIDRYLRAHALRTYCRASINARARVIRMSQMQVRPVPHPLAWQRHGPSTERLVDVYGVVDDRSGRVQRECALRTCSEPARLRCVSPSDEPLRDLLREFSPTGPALHPEYPFFYLQNDVYGDWTRRLNTHRADRLRLASCAVRTLSGRSKFQRRVRRRTSRIGAGHIASRTACRGSERLSQ